MPESRYANTLRSMGFKEIPREHTTTFLRRRYPENFSPHRAENPSFMASIDPELTIAFDETGQGWIALKVENLDPLGFENKSKLMAELLKGFREWQQKQRQ